jgi:hypothetical protein
MPSTWEDIENTSVFESIDDVNHDGKVDHDPNSEEAKARKTITVYSVVAYCNANPFESANDYECHVAWDVPDTSTGQFTIQVSPLPPCMLESSSRV